MNIQYNWQITYELFLESMQYHLRIDASRDFILYMTSLCPEHFKQTTLIDFLNLCIHNQYGTDYEFDYRVLRRIIELHIAFHGMVTVKEFIEMCDFLINKKYNHIVEKVLILMFSEYGHRIYPVEYQKIISSFNKNCVKDIDIQNMPCSDLYHYLPKDFVQEISPFLINYEHRK
jgi:hypothetical protein